MKYIVVVLSIYFLFVQSHQNDIEPCSHDSVMRRFFDDNPGYEEIHFQFYQKMIEKARNHILLSKAKGISLKETQEIIRIPVVWHVLYNSDDTYIDSTTIQNEMNYLNEWFSAQNKYYQTTSDFWNDERAVASDFQIEFELATLDPDRLPTSGITYRETDVATSCGEYEIFDENQGGIDIWDSRFFMNVYTCNIQNAAGYAYLPSSFTHSRDGIVLRPDVVGSSYIAGSVLSHEAGHWLGLQHTFVSCDFPGDGIDDTPYTNEPALYWVSSQAACPGYGGTTDASFQRCGNIVMIQNNMDYNYEYCKTFFSKGQVALMRQYLEDEDSVRSDLDTSYGLGYGNEPCANFNCDEKQCGDDGCGGSCGTCDLNSQNTMCNNFGMCVPNPSGVSNSPTRTPTPSISIPTIADEMNMFRDLVTNYHNDLRSTVDPEPERLLTPLSYSVQIENDASSFTDGCSWTYARSSNYGANQYATTVTGDSLAVIQSAMQSWASSKSHYHLTNNGDSCDPGFSCNSYKQMIWDNERFPTTQIACSVTECSTGSPFGSSNPNWSNVLCYYQGPGNYIGYYPYDPCNGCTDVLICRAVCPDNTCGTYITDCGFILDCGCCDDPCLEHECGYHVDACGVAINCGSCEDGFSCGMNEEGLSICEEVSTCNHLSECELNGYECNCVSYCGITDSCGSCDNGQICDNFICVDDICGKCSINSYCDQETSECICFDGFITDELGNCISPNSGGGTGLPDFSRMVSQTMPDGEPNFIVERFGVKLLETGDHILNWNTSEGVIDEFTTTTTVSIDMGSGDFGFNIRYGQSSTSREHDRIMWFVKNIGTRPQATICLVYFGDRYCGQYYDVNLSHSKNTLTVLMGYDDNNNILTTFTIEDGTTFNSYVPHEYYPNIGCISYFISPNEGIALLSDFDLETSAVMASGIDACIDDIQWEGYFYDLSLADFNSTTMEITPDSENINCNDSNRKSKFTAKITSKSVPASSLGSTYISSIGSPAAASFGISDASLIKRTDGATEAGFPTSIDELDGIYIKAPNVEDSSYLDEDEDDDMNTSTSPNSNSNSNSFSNGSTRESSSGTIVFITLSLITFVVVIQI